MLSNSFKSQSPNAQPAASFTRLRFIVGIFLTLAIVTIFLTVSFWLGNLLKEKYSFFGFPAGTWLGTGLFYTLNFWRADFESMIIRQFEEMMGFGVE